MKVRSGQSNHESSRSPRNSNGGGYYHPRPLEVRRGSGCWSQVRASGWRGHLAGAIPLVEEFSLPMLIHLSPQERS